MEIILPQTIKRIDHIIHISDIHIRTGTYEQSRFTEYEIVFKNLFQQIESILKNPGMQNTTILVCTGDIFHNKNKLETCGIRLYINLITGLAKLLPVLMILGNHDFRAEQPDDPDMIESMQEIFAGSNTIHYLNKTGFYKCCNIGFGVVTIKDLLVRGATAQQIAELPDFPKPLDCETKIALFHGMINGCTLQNYKKSPEGFPIGWFAGYDFGLFGDIHLQQIVGGQFDSGRYVAESNKLMWGYPGSLIQQNFGEPIFGHGFILWNLKDRHASAHHVPNPTAQVTLKYCADSNSKLGWQCKMSKFVPLDAATQLPTNLLIRIIANAETNIGMNELPQLLAGHNYSIVSKTIESEDFVTATVAVSDESNYSLDQFNTPATWIQYIDQNKNPQIIRDDSWKRWISKLEFVRMMPTAYPQSMQDKIAERNKKLDKMIAEFTDSLSQVSRKQVLSLQYIEFDWILCFRENCWYNFQDTSSNITSLSAANGHGKSSLLEIICLAIFGESIPSRSDKSFSASIISQQKSETNVSRINLYFKLGQKFYLIKRTFSFQVADKTKLKQNVEIFELDEAVYATCNVKTSDLRDFKTGITACKLWITENIGTFESFLLACLVTQNFDQDFFEMPEKSQFALIDGALNLGSISSLIEIFKQASLDYKYIGDILDSVSKEGKLKMPVTPSGGTCISDEKFQEMKTEFTKLSAQFTETKNKYSQIVPKWSTEDEVILLDQSRQLPELSEIITDQNLIKQLEYEISQLPSNIPDVLIPLSVNYNYFSKISKLHLQEFKTLSDFSKFVGAASNLGPQIEELKKIAPAAAPPSAQSKPDKLLPQEQAAERSAILRVEISKFDTAKLKLAKPWLESRAKIIEFANLNSQLEEINKKLQWLKLSDVDRKLKLIDLWPLERIEKYRKFHELQQKHEELSAQIAETKTNPFNHECWACKKQHWVIELERKKTRLQELVSEIQQIGQLEPQSPNEYNEAAQLHNQAAQLREFSAATQTKHELQQKLSELGPDLPQPKDVESILYGIDNMEKYNSLTTEYKELVQMLAYYDAYNYAKLQELIKLQEFYYYYQWVHSMQVAKAALAKTREYNILKFRPLYNEWTKLRDELMQLKQKIIPLKTEIDQNEKIIEMQKSNSLQLESLIELGKKHEYKMKCLNHIGDLFKDFRIWLYRNKIIPKIITETNKLVATLNGSNSLMLSVRWNENNSFIWFMKDGNNMPHIKKASGFQRFALGLSVRIILSYLGSSNAMCKQLFIDEGFVSCDDAHKGLIPQFLNSLLGIYDSILIVSHMQEVKEAATLTATIERRTDKSRIQFGTQIKFTATRNTGKKVLTPTQYDDTFDY